MASTCYVAAVLGLSVSQRCGIRMNLQLSAGIHKPTPYKPHSKQNNKFDHMGL